MISQCIDDEVKKRDLTNFRVEEITANDKVILVKARRESPVYFCFYSHFIVCSGDYGEWVFDCTWDTAKCPLPKSLYYLVGKLSRNCKPYVFDSQQAVQDIEGLVEALVVDMNYELTEDQKQELEDTFYDFKSAIDESDEYRHISVVDEHVENIADCLGIEIDGEQMSLFYEAGLKYNGQLITNLAMLAYIRDNHILDQYYTDKV